MATIHQAKFEMGSFLTISKNSLNPLGTGSQVLVASLFCQMTILAVLMSIVEYSQLVVVQRQVILLYIYCLRMSMFSHSFCSNHVMAQLEQFSCQKACMPQPSINL